MDVACPNCGNPHLDVDAENSVVYCKKCGFAVRVDPNTGETTPLNPGAQPGSAAGAPEVYAGGNTIFGMEPFMFWMVGTAVLLFLTLLAVIPDLLWFLGLEVLLTLFWWMRR